MTRAASARTRYDEQRKRSVLLCGAMDWPSTDALSSRMAVTRMAEELHRCASSRRAMEQLRTAQVCNGKASSRCAQICKGEASICCGTAAISSGTAVLCDGKARQRLLRVGCARQRKVCALRWKRWATDRHGSEWLWKRTAVTGGGGAKKGVGDDLRGHAAELLGYDLHCVGLAAKGRAKAQKSAAQKSKCIEKQGH